MAIWDCARAAVRYFSREQAITIVAIGGPESGWNLIAAGDPWYIFPPAEHAAYVAWSCGENTAFGWLQVNLRWNHDHVAALGGGSTPCEQATWLWNYDNSARAGKRIFDNQGFRAWTAYNVNAHAQYLDDARYAVDLALEGAPAPGPVGAIAPPLQAVAPPARVVVPPERFIALE